jgi:hypothetical protein
VDLNGSPLLVRILEPGAPPDDLEEQRLRLREELLQLDVDDVTRPPASAPPPPGARAIELAQVGTLLVAMKSSVELMKQVIETIRSWLREDPERGRTVELVLGSDRITLTGVAREHQDRLIEQFVAAIEDR